MLYIYNFIAETIQSSSYQINGVKLPMKMYASKSGITYHCFVWHSWPFYAAPFFT